MVFLNGAKALFSNIKNKRKVASLCLLLNFTLSEEKHTLSFRNKCTQPIFHTDFFKKEFYLPTINLFNMCPLRSQFGLNEFADLSL